MSFFKPLIALSCYSLMAYSGSALASSCSKTDIDHYLQSGFTHAQVVKLCTDTPAATQGSSSLYESISKPRASVTSTTATAITPASAQGSSEDKVYFETVIDANPVDFSNNQLVFERKECALYGDLDITESKPKVCVNTRTTVNLKGMEIVKATKGVVLIRQQELIVKGDVTREYLNISRLNKHKAAAVREQMPTKPSKFNIPIRKGIDPKAVAVKLKKYR